MGMNCEQVWQEISNYLESDLDPGAAGGDGRAFRECRRCTAVLAGNAGT